MSERRWSKLTFQNEKLNLDYHDQLIFIISHYVVDTNEIWVVTTIKITQLLRFDLQNLIIIQKKNRSLFNCVTANYPCDTNDKYHFLEETSDTNKKIMTSWNQNSAEKLSR